MQRKNQKNREGVAAPRPAWKIGTLNTTEITTTSFASATAIAQAAALAFRRYLDTAIAVAVLISSNAEGGRDIRLALREQRLAWAELSRAADAARLHAAMEG